MNHETAVAMAVVLAVIIITVLYTLISGGLGIGEQGVGNITERAQQDDTGMNLDFTSADKQYENQFSRVEKHYNNEVAHL